MHGYTREELEELLAEMDRQNISHAEKRHYLMDQGFTSAECDRLLG